MGWVTPIRAPEQVDYRLSRDCGCDVDRDAQVEYRLASETDLRWIGSGLGEVGLTAGGPVDPDAARALMDGRDPRTGAQLVQRKRVLDPRGKVAAHVLVDAVAALAEADGVTSAEYLGGGPLAERLARAGRGVRREGERHLLPLADAERIAAAAGLDVEALYGADVVAQARPWAGRHVDVGLRGVDLVLDIPKSISTAWALAPDDVAAGIQEEWHAAVSEAVTEALEPWTAYGMAGHHGDGQQAERVATSGLLGWTTLHRSARPVDGAVGDPHLHTHVNIAHMAKGADGKWRTIAAGAEDLLRHGHLVNEIAEARLRQRLTARFGARWERSATTGAWELAGVSEQLRDAFSRRHHQVVADVGEGATRDQQKAAARRTAESKLDPDQQTERTGWRARAVATMAGDLSGLDDDERLVVLAEAGAAVDAMVRGALPGPDGATPTAGGPDGPVLPTPERIASQIWDDLEHGLVASEKVVSHTHVMAAVVQALPYLDSVEQLAELVDQVLAVDGHAVRLTDSNRAHQVHRQRYTHTSVIEAESTIIESAATGLGRGLAQLTPEAAGLTMAVAEAAKSTRDRPFEFSAEQRAVIVRLLTAGHAVDAVVGVAGAGKTTLMQAARAGWEAAGLRVVGASTAAVAAANLAAEAGIDSRTIAAWTRDISGGRGLDGVGVLVVDEGAMVDDRALAALLRHASTTGTKVIGLGDPLQLRAVGIGGGFARIHQIVDGLTLSENRRQADEVERAALQTWRDGGRTSALAILAGHGHVHAVDTVDQAHEAMLAAWDRARSRWAGDPHGQVHELLLLAARRADVAQLNAGARALRVAAGELTGGQLFRAPEDGGRVEFAPGDLVHVRQNDYRSRRGGTEPDVLNGFRGIALDVDARRGVLVEWRRPDSASGHRTDRAWMSPRDVAEGRLTHGYAMTIGSAQGLTSTVTIASGRGADAHSLYPALSRARQETHLVLPLAELEDDVTRITLGQPRTEAERLDRAVAAYGRQLEGGREDVMVVDELAAAERGVPVAVPVPDQHRHASGEVPAQRQEPPVVEQPDGFRTGRVVAPEPVEQPAETPGRQPTSEEIRRALAELDARLEEVRQAQQIPGWRERPYGRVATNSLLPRAEKAEAEASQARATAYGLDVQAERLAAVLGTDQSPGRLRVAKTSGHLDAAEQLLGQADAAVKAAADIDSRIGELYATNREELLAERRIRERAALRRSAVFMQRGGMLEAADALRERADQRVTQIQTLRQEALDLRGQSEELRRRARAEVDSADGGMYGDVERRIAQQRAALPEMAERLDQRDLREHQRLVTQAGVQRRSAEELDQRGAGLREEAGIRERLPAGRRTTEAVERTTAIREANARRAAEQAAAAERQRQHEQYSYRYEPPTQGRSGPSIGR
ncbi:MobF family relaxase [Kitasatospora sp. NPDC127121]|uniref:MobF family relaxase n=1 Tax=Kitasatospora sp. NPDC127121 TaxID=3345371 RepID=UPI0036388A07